MISKSFGIAILVMGLMVSKPLLAKTLIVSDIDDTIKMSDILGSKIKIAYKAFAKGQAFSGMSELYQNLMTKDSKIFYISGSPGYMKKKVENFLSSNEFPQFENIILRKSLSDDIYYYKYGAITKLLNEEKPDKVLFIGDDTEYDPEIFEQISHENPGLVKGIYIRSVQHRYVDHLDGVKTFFAPIEIALNEAIDFNIEFYKLKKIAESFYKNEPKKAIAISYRYCPLEGRKELDNFDISVFLDGGIEITTLIKSTQEKISTDCKKMKIDESNPVVNIQE